MNNKISSNMLATWLVGIALNYTASVALAGPLDRDATQSRQNPAANSMIRVPGVLGQSEQYALETLQRAGLNVNTKYIRQSRKKYASRNGKVVKQIPSAGGIAMLGSSVTITIYKVKGEPVDESGGSYGGSGSGYDDSGYGTGGSGSGSGYGTGGSGSSDGSGYGTGRSGGDYGDGSKNDIGGNSGGRYDDSDSSQGSGDYGTDDTTPGDDSSGPDWGSSGSDKNFTGNRILNPYTKEKKIELRNEQIKK